MATPWYKRIFAWFGSNDQAEEIQEPEVHYSLPPSSRTKAIFRFPVVPDDEFNALDNREQRARQIDARSERESEVQRKEREQQLKEREQFFKERDKLFQEKGWLKKAQDVPSPIYGFNRPPESTIRNPISSEEDKEKVAWTKPVKLELDHTGLTGYDEIEAGSDDREQIDRAKLEREIKEQERDETVLINDKTIERDALVQEEGNPVERVPTPAPAPAPVVSITETTIVDQSNKVEVKPTSRIPYNVFYFGQQGNSTYHFPKLQFLKPSPPATEDDQNWQAEMVDNLEQTLLSFNVQAKVVGITRGPTVTRIEIQPSPGVKVNRITNLSDDIKLNLAAKDIRIEAPVPGKSAVGIEVPNLVREPVNIVDILSSSAFRDSKSPMSVALGKDIEGKPVVIDLRKMPHGLIAGSTGSGKSVCINSIIISLLYKATPEEVKMILIDPKMVELAPYHDLPHLATPVVTDPKQATMALKWAVEEMDRRYELFAETGVRDIARYNQLISETQPEVVKPALPYLIIVIDELADLMMVAPGDVEESIARLAQKARACGIHLLVATQRPSVDVITGMIKANIPTRIAFSVSSQVDSRTILDSVGAERLLGRGDMLLMENGSNKAVRLQGNFVADEEIEAVCNFVRSQRKPKFLFDKESLIKAVIEEPEDDLFKDAIQFVLEQETASTSLLQRKFRIGYNRAARLIDMMEERGMISEASGSKPRNVLVTQEEYTELVEG